MRHMAYGCTHPTRTCLGLRHEPRTLCAPSPNSHECNCPPCDPGSLQTFTREIQHKGWMGGWLMPQVRTGDRGRAALPGS